MARFSDGDIVTPIYRRKVHENQRTQPSQGQGRRGHQGRTTAHIRIDIGNGSIVTSSITNEAVDELGLTVGADAYAVIKASDVMVAVDWSFTLFGSNAPFLVAGLEIAGLWRRDRFEQAPIRLEVEKRRAIEAIETPHEQGSTFDRLQFDDRRADRIWPHRRAQRKCTVHLAVAGWALQNEITAGTVQPIENFQPLEGLHTLERRHPWLENLDSAKRSIMPALAQCLHP